MASALVSCTQYPSPQEIIEKAKMATFGFSTVSFDMTMEFEFGGYQMNMTGYGYAEKPDKAYIYMYTEFSGTMVSVEMIELGDDGYLRASTDYRWVHTAEGKDLNLISIAWTMDEYSTGKPMLGMSLEGTVTIDGTEYYKIVTHQDFSGNLAFFLPAQELGQDVKMEVVDSRSTILIASDTFLPYSTDVFVELSFTSGGMTFTISGTLGMQYHDYGEPVIFPDIGL